MRLNEKRFSSMGRKRFGTNVFSPMCPFEVDTLDAIVSMIKCFLKRCPDTSDTENTSTGCDKLAISLLRACMEHDDVRKHFSLIDAGDRQTFLIVRRRVAAGCHHDTGRKGWAPSDVDLVEPSFD